MLLVGGLCMVVVLAFVWGSVVVTALVAVAFVFDISLSCSFSVGSCCWSSWMLCS